MGGEVRRRFETKLPCLVQPHAPDPRPNRRRIARRRAGELPPVERALHGIDRRARQRDDDVGQGIARGVADNAGPSRVRPEAIQQQLGGERDASRQRSPRNPPQWRVPTPTARIPGDRSPRVHFDRQCRMAGTPGGLAQEGIEQILRDNGAHTGGPPLAERRGNDQAVADITARNFDALPAWPKAVIRSTHTCLIASRAGFK